jgi:hypothetical protein
MAQKKYKPSLWNLINPWTAIPGVNQFAQENPWINAAPALALAPFALPALGAGAAAGSATAGTAAGAGASIPVSGGLASGMSLAGMAPAAAPTMGSAGTFMGGMSNMASAHPGWTALLKSMGTSGAQKGMEYFSAPPKQKDIYGNAVGWDNVSGGFEGNNQNSVYAPQMQQLMSYFAQAGRMPQQGGY